MWTTLGPDMLAAVDQTPGFVATAVDAERNPSPSSATMMAVATERIDARDRSIPHPLLSRGLIIGQLLEACTKSDLGGDQPGLLRPLCVAMVLLR